MKEFKVVVVVSPDRSDLYFANQLMKKVNVVGVIIENQTYPRDNRSTLQKTLQLLHKPHILISKIIQALKNRIRKKYAVYNQAENITDFGDEGQTLFPNDHVKTLYTSGVNDINSAENIAWLKALEPDVVAVCGASIMKDEIISVPKKGVLNLHGGLSQKYRGLFTTDWAVYNEEPEYVGATVHFVSPGIDDGDIVYQGRPLVETDDNSNSLYVKVVKLGVKMMKKAIDDIENDQVKATPLSQKGDLYLKNMFTHKIQNGTWKKVSQGVIENYLQNKENRDSKVASSMINAFTSDNKSKL